jgi:hypothetical protein
MMKTRRIWLPTNLPELAAWFANFALKFAEFYTALGFTAGDNTTVQNDNASVQWVNDAMSVNESNTAALRTFRDITLYGEKNDAPPTEPSMNLPPPPTDFTSSIVQRVATLADKIELADNYTPDIGAQLGIIQTKKVGLIEESVKPAIRVAAGAGNYDFTTVITDKGKSDQADLQIRRLGQEKWESLKQFTGKSCTAQYKPDPEGAPVKIEVRVQLSRRNEKYGHASDPVYITLNP